MTKLYVIKNSDTTYYHKDKACNILHREDGPAIEYPCGTKLWFYNNLAHREGGPAVEYSSGTTKWFVHGKLHREDGPAVEHENGIKKWYLNDKEYSEEEHKRLVKMINFL